MRIVFDPDFDSGAWPGPLTGRDAAAGEAWSGPTGFLDQLETRLGLGGPRASPVERIASLLTPVRQVAGFWSRSAEADVVETAAALVRLRQAITSRLGWSALRPVQELAGEALLEGKNAVILAPTAGGKTEAAVFPLLAELMEREPHGVGLIYLAPLRALLNNQEERLGTYTEHAPCRRGTASRWSVTTCWTFPIVFASSTKTNNPDRPTPVSREPRSNMVG